MRGGPSFLDSLAALLRLVLSALRRQFHVPVAEVGFEGRSPAEGRMRPLGILVGHPLADPGPRLGAGLESVEIDALVLQRTP